LRLLGEPALVIWDELRQHAEASWPLKTNSQGGKTLYRYVGHLYVVGYGEFSSLPGGAEQILEVRPDNLPGFAPLMDGGHAAGCRHERHWDWDWWTHRGFLLRVENGVVRLYQDAKEAWTCPLDEFMRPGSPRHEDVLRKLGPAVADEALRCATVRAKR
jgi:hypothetical protein